MLKKLKQWRKDKKLEKTLMESRKKEALELQALMDDLKRSTDIETIEEIERRTFYDVTFKVMFKNGSKVNVTLDECREMKDFIRMIKTLNEVTIDSLRTLDERNSIYYD